MPRMLRVLNQHPERGASTPGIPAVVVYGNMPVFGLAAAPTRLPAAQEANTAAARIGASAADEPAVEPY